MGKALRVAWYDGTAGTLDPPLACRRVSVRRHVTPQVRPMRTARPMSNFLSIKQKNEWDGQPVQAGTLAAAPCGARA